MSALRPIALCASLLVGACSYDLTVLEGRRTDAGRMDVASPDVAAPDVAEPEVTPADVAPDRPPPVDTGPARMPMNGTCNVMGVTPVPLAMGTPGVTVNGNVLTLEGTTVNGGPNVPGCEQMKATPMSTRVYRYTVRTGPRLVATTNTGLCAMAGGVSDTILGAYFNCTATGLVPGPRSCVDDDRINVCERAAEPCASNLALGCGNKFSTLELSALVPGDVVYLAVSSYPEPMARQGTFRLSVAENGLSPIAPAEADMRANRCACPPSTGAVARPVEFPRANAANQLAGANRFVAARLPIPLSRMWGVSGSLRLSRFNVSTSGACAITGGATAALDLTVGLSVVASVTLGVYVGDAGTVNIPYTSFAPIMFEQGSMQSFQYRIRNVQPANADCITLDVDTSSTDNTLTLYGAP